MSNYQQIVPIAHKILQKYDLCDHCLGRLFSKQLRLSSNKTLGKKLKKSLSSSQKCYICKNLFDNLTHFLKLMTDASSSYLYDTFSVGAIVKPSIIDRDDSIRSTYKLRGIDSIKTDITKELGKVFARKTRKVIDPLDPELIFTLNLKDESCELRSKAIILSGRYVKTMRGLPQKQKSCDNCLGKGCRTCDFHGMCEFESVEGVIAKFLFKKFGGTTTKFTWVGGEDKSSLVLGSGRPFFVKLQNPLKRKLRLSHAKFDSLQINHLKLVHKSPKIPLKFYSTVKVKITTSSKIDSKNLKKLKKLEKNSVMVYDKSGKRSEKKIFTIKYSKNSKNVLTLIFKAESGLPIKRFVTSDDVSPGISTIFGTSCVCQEFDFYDIEV
ncbi:tRNA pseudouridine(54/55) synthase Pus10 [Nitrosopumilus sp.]|uniref:tRNA pseudouridine(54/55) synthase Pus10 n=1 Tax=Nitrosopumilus sp. TaxID=2024843 RepID=UPI0034A05032